MFKITEAGTVEVGETLPKNQEFVGKVVRTYEKSGETKLDTCISICRLKGYRVFCLSDDYALNLECRTHKLKKTSVKNNYTIYIG